MAIQKRDCDALVCAMYWGVTAAASALTVLLLVACGTQSTVARNSIDPNSVGSEPFVGVAEHAVGGNGAGAGNGVGSEPSQSNLGALGSGTPNTTNGPNSQSDAGALNSGTVSDDSAVGTVSGDILSGTTPPTDTIPSNAVVERVVDGDTIIADISGRSESVRLIGINTPESVARTRPVQCFGEEASLYTQALLPAGTPVTLVLDTEARDAYDRLLAYVVRSDDGLFVNLELVEAGYAAAFDYPPNDHYSTAFARAESAAIAAGRGLWSACGGPDVPVS